MSLALSELFEKLSAKTAADYEVSICMLEVYNETCKDLLTPSSKNVVIREGGKAGVAVAGLSRHAATTADGVLDLLQKGNKNRTVEPTLKNQTSSRSHAILQVHVKLKEDGVLKLGKLSLVDLAGSERALATEARTARTFEGANINKSLLALSSCIQSLVSGKTHVPYRNSKLTMLLKDSLGGNCDTTMIANVSPSLLSYGENSNTLHWADQAKQIRTTIQANTRSIKNLPLPTSPGGTEVARRSVDDPWNTLVQQLRLENDELRKKLTAAKNGSPNAQVETLKQELKRKTDHAMALEEQLVQIQDSFQAKLDAKDEEIRLLREDRDKRALFDESTDMNISPVKVRPLARMSVHTCEKQCPFAFLRGHSFVVQTVPLLNLCLCHYLPCSFCLLRNTSQKKIRKERFCAPHPAGREQDTTSPPLQTCLTKPWFPLVNYEYIMGPGNPEKALLDY
eukprot:scaffold974_cov368-Prasinococcus_capsulatus_cf.AAC.6